ncbi:cupin domain-containing protein [Pseudonocardia spinosispora]|uniref:cupin domain-containing protein n=1 Tax=Pseudonocardia spinosispora TaxID=103441 RepID=UPI0004189CEE|nr:cupin domain-containing protein [Pseudonocardia spinosispora]
MSGDVHVGGFVRHRGGPDESGLLLSSVNVPEIEHCLGVATVPEGVVVEHETVHTTGEVMYVAAGSGELRRDGDPIAFQQGDAIFIPPGRWHSLANTGVGELVSVFSFPSPSRPPSESRPAGGR